MFLERICGIAAISPNVISRKRIVGGMEVVANSWPWQASLQLDGESLKTEVVISYAQSF